MTVTRVPVPVVGSPYEVVIGPGLLGRLADLVPWPPSARVAALVAPEPVWALYGERLAAALGRAGLEPQRVPVPDGEEAKTLGVLERAYRRLAAVPLQRGDVVVGLGGGVTTDLAGFVAATWHRGVAFVAVPTTLLGMVDAAVGGKTGVNLPEGKNLVGAFHQPVAVVADTATLATLPERERRAGLGEVVKYGYIADPAVLEALERDPEGAVRCDEAVIREVVARGVAVKAEIVAADEREAGRRMLLNYGHTVGHAIETLTSYGRYRHGEAVALGMVFAARLGERLGVSVAGLADRTETLLGALGLPTGGLRLDPEAVRQVLVRDKKARGGVRFVLCRQPGDAVVVDEPPSGLVAEVLATLA